MNKTLCKSDNHIWQPDKKRPRWEVCSVCFAIKDDSRNIKPKIWNVSPVVPSGHFISSEKRDGETLTFSVCDDVPNICPEFHPISGELINIFFDDAKGMGYMITCAECIEKWQQHKGIL